MGYRRAPMKIYTQVLIGMAVGALIGIFLGPKSEFLEKDTFIISDAGGQSFYLNKDDPSSQVEFPAEMRLNLQSNKLAYEMRTDAKGEQVKVPVWAEVQLKWKKEFALADGGGQLKGALGNPKPGKKVKLWLELKNVELPSGGFLTMPERVSGLGDTIVTWLRPVGTAFMRLIKMVIVPLVFASLVVGVASLGDVRKLGRLGAKTLGLYLMTTAIAVTIGLVTAHLINPGSQIGERDRAALQSQFAGDATSKAESAAKAPSTIDNILSIIPTNPVESLSSGNMLQIIFFAMIFGIALTLLDTGEGRIVVTMLDRIQQAMVLIIHMVMAVAPFGVAALVADVVGQSGVSVLLSLLVYGLAVVIGLILQATLVYGGLVVSIVRISLLDFLRAIRPAQLIAFSTSSSSATLPVTMECAEENLNISNPISSFVLPLGSTVNMDGTALYQGVAAIFIAQVFQIDLTLGDQITIVLTATMASIGAAGVPGAGMVTLALVLTATGIPPVGIALILGLDRLLDMFRTAINVTGDLAVTAVMAKTEGENVRVISPQEDAANPDRGFEGRLHREAHPVEPDDPDEEPKR